MQHIEELKEAMSGYVEIDVFDQEVARVANVLLDDVHSELSEKIEFLEKQIRATYNEEISFIKNMIID